MEYRLGVLWWIVHIESLFVLLIAIMNRLAENIGTWSALFFMVSSLGISVYCR